jgi:multidrug resistance efflux pump
MALKLLTTSLVAALSLGVAAAVARADDKKPADAPQGLKFTGHVRADALVGLSARVAGAVDKVNVDAGDRIKKGQVLIELWAPELKDDLDAAAAKLDRAKAAVEQAEAATQAAKAQLARAEAALEAARAAVKRAKAGADQVQAEADRVRRLVETAAASREEQDAHVHQADAARAAVEEAEAQVKTFEAAREAAAAEVGQAQAGVNAAQADVAVAQAAVRRADTEVGFTKIVAPFDGVVARRTVDAGATVGPPRQGESAPLITVMRDDVVRVVFDVDERDASRVTLGAAAVIRVAALGDAEIKGKVARMDPTINRDAGTFSVEVDLPNPEGKLRPGMFATVELKADAPGK